MSLTLIETKTLLSAAASIEFTSIPQDGTDLFLLASLRANNGGIPNDTFFAFNGSSPTGRLIYGTGGVAGSSAAVLAISNGGGATSNTFSNISLYIPNYTSSSNKSFSVDSAMENNASESYQNIAAGLWSNTAAITSVRFTADASALYVIGSTISLYKITKGSDGIVTTS
jgi:hypothetical protein